MKNNFHRASIHHSTVFQRQILWGMMTDEARIARPYMGAHRYLSQRALKGSTPCKEWWLLTCWNVRNHQRICPNHATYALVAISKSSFFGTCNRQRIYSQSNLDFWERHSNSLKRLWLRVGGNVKAHLFYFSSNRCFKNPPSSRQVLFL